MKNSRFVCLISLIWLIVGLGCAKAETPDAAVAHVWKAFFAQPDRGDNFSPAFWKYSKSIAREQGVTVIPAILARAKSWKSEEVLVFVPLVSYLPRERAVPMLEKAKATGTPSEVQGATDLLIELKSLDSK